MRRQVEKSGHSLTGLFALLLLAGQPAIAQRDPLHCDSMVRAAMQGYQISKDEPCIDLSGGDWPKQLCIIQNLSITVSVANEILDVTNVHGFTFVALAAVYSLNKMGRSPNTAFPQRWNSTQSPRRSRQCSVRARVSGQVRRQW